MARQGIDALAPLAFILVFPAKIVGDAIPQGILLYGELQQRKVRPPWLCTIGIVIEHHLVDHNRYQWFLPKIAKPLVDGIAPRKAAARVHLGIVKLYIRRSVFL
ncbi:hypothetical protein SDC9_173899 [bioreactor metagenome]|uniref:Uncharacterized protein n=1 Tax=bioreactor metagenome TaxID=1076179 RepID=A0A645GR83_9ZZZZ